MLPKRLATYLHPLANPIPNPIPYVAQFRYRNSGIGSLVLVLVLADRQNQEPRIDSSSSAIRSSRTERLNVRIECTAECPNTNPNIGASLMNVRTPYVSRRTYIVLADA